jgi:DNA-binding response OmpR family regulator
MDTPTGRILVVDDDEVIRSMLKVFLEDDYEVICADNSIEGLRLAQFEPFDLILLDVQMPIFDGRDLCESLKEDPATSDIPIIFISALSSTEDQVKCFQAGAADFVGKPLIEEIVQARVKVHIELKQQRDYLHKLTTTDPE